MVRPGLHLLRASPCGQQTAKPPRPRKSRDGGSIPGPARHFGEVIGADAWPGSCRLSPDRIVAIVLFRPAGLPTAGSMMTIPSAELPLSKSVTSAPSLPCFSLWHGLRPFPAARSAVDQSCTGLGKSHRLSRESMASILIGCKRHSGKTKRRVCITVSRQTTNSRVPRSQSSSTMIPSGLAPRKHMCFKCRPCSGISFQGNPRCRGANPRARCRTVSRRQKARLPKTCALY